jgi:hypothetical protein
MHHVPQAGLTLPAVAGRRLNEGLGPTACNHGIAAVCCICALHMADEVASREADSVRVNVFDYRQFKLEVTREPWHVLRRAPKGHH